MANRGDFGSFVPTTQVWDSNEIYSTEVTSPEFKELLVRLYQNLNSQAMAINIKDSGLYDTSEFVNGQTFFVNPLSKSYNTTDPAMRQVFRKVINFGALPNTGSTSVAHGIDITADYTFTRIYGASSKTTAPASYIPLPYASSIVTQPIEVSVSATNVTISTGTNWAGYDVTYIILEYLKH